MLFFLIYEGYVIKKAEERKNFIRVRSAIFAAQMLNWPILGGMSLHFIGGGFSGLHSKALA